MYFLKTKTWVKWTRAEEMALYSAFPKVIRNPNAHIPGQIAINNIVEKYPVLQNRSYKNIYFKIIRMQKGRIALGKRLIGGQT